MKHAPFNSNDPLKDEDNNLKPWFIALSIGLVVLLIAFFAVKNLADKERQEGLTNSPVLNTNR